MVDGIFCILNTLQLGLVFWYGYRKYIRDSLQRNMTQAHTNQINMQRKHEQLRKQEQGLVRAYYHQNYRYEELSNKVEAWAQQVSKARHEQELVSEQCGIEQERRFQERQKYVQVRTVGTQLLEPALQEIEHSMKAWLESKGNVVKMTDALIKEATGKKGAHE